MERGEKRRKTQSELLDADVVLSQLDIDEKIALLSGIDFWHTKTVPRLNIPSLRTSDGPNGVRGTRFFNGVPAACFPCGTGLAATWDVELIEAGGKLMAAEAIAKGVSVILGPTVNMQRSPLGGRGFESYSEDPVLAGEMSAATVRGIQSQGVAATIKHFVCNDQEDQRMAVDSLVTDRALREIYLKPFQIAQRDAKPMAYMTAYNKINGTHVSANYRILQEILRNEWGFDGLIMSDWFGTYSAAESINAGLDLEMPGPPRVRGQQAKIALDCNRVSGHQIDQRVRNLLNLVNRVHPLGIPENAPERSIDSPETSAQLRNIATSGIVLLKNESGVLPFDKTKKIAVIGPNAKFAAYSGGGSASLTPYYARTPFEGITAQAKDVHYALGATGHKMLPDLGKMTTTPDGKPGIIAKFYNEPPDAPTRRCIDEIHVTSTDMLLADYTHPDLTSDIWYMDLEGTFTPSTTGRHLFGLAVCGTATLSLDAHLLIDNATHQDPGDTFFGAGTIEARASSPALHASHPYAIHVHFGSSPTSPLRRAGVTVMAGGGLRLGCSAAGSPAAEIEHAVRLAESADQVLLCVGLNRDWESEGYDRPDLDLPGAQDALVAAVVAAAAPAKTAVVLQSGTPVAMPWLADVPAVVWAGYGGNETGNAIADVVFGEVSPSGKLPLSWPVRVEDNPAFLNYRSERGRVLYGEDVYVGYRFYEMVGREVNFPFGHGLSYTTFELRHLRLEAGETMLKLAVEVANVGERPGAEVVQVYVSQREPSINRPRKELAGFKKAWVEPGETVLVEIEMSKRYTCGFWDEERGMWIMEEGFYDVLVGNSSASTPLKESVFVGKTVWWSGL